MKHSANPLYEKFFQHLPTPDEPGEFNIPEAVKNLNVCASCITQIRLTAHKNRDIEMLRDVHILTDELRVVKHVLAVLMKATDKKKTFFIPEEKNA